VEEIVIETGAGVVAAYTDEAFAEAGAMIVPDAASAAAAADVIFKIQRPMAAADGIDELALLRHGQVLMSPLGALTNAELVSALASKGVTSFALELIPRITRAQSMDILSSQSNLAGYKAVVDAASAYGRAFPMMMTAAGTVSAAKLFVMGVGVAGLQAIATGRRLGAQVSATDVRSATKEQIQSLGAKPIFVENVAGIEGEGSGGYAGEMSPEYQAAQGELVSAHIAKQDIVITTALIPGRPAPRLIRDAQVASMRAGSVIVDLAAEAGGNVEGVHPGETVIRHGVTLIGPVQLSRSLAADSSALFARNLYNFLAAFWDKEAGGPILSDDDEIVKAIRLTRDGAIVSERLTA
jgi:NAD(P) transhydrogenase subunit alpha